MLAACLLSVAILAATAAAAVVPAAVAANYVNQTSYLFRSTTDPQALQVAANATAPAGYAHVASIVCNVSYLDLGWDYIQVAPAPWLLLQSEPDAYFLSGYLEGYATYARMDQILTANNFSATTPVAAKQWVREHIAYMNATAISRGAAEPFWFQVGLLLSLMQGLTDGYTAANRATGNGQPSYTFFDIFLLNFGNDLGDVVTATNMLSVQAVRNAKEQHCSALVKVTADDIFFSHVTWGTYNTMVRQFKTYVMATTVTFSAVAGTVASGDDWYMTSNLLAVQETTNEFDNASLYALIKPNSVSEFMRTMVANFLATTGAEWVDYFATNHSGTYCNQYMVLDYKLYTPGQQGTALADNLLWVAEEIPGLVQSGDMTEFLRNRSYWASYNLPFFPDIFAISGFAAQEQEFGPVFSYHDYARATIFARNQSMVADLPSMQRLMRYNDFERDPLSEIPRCPECSPKSSPWLTIASRGDLVTANASGLPSNPAYAGFFEFALDGGIDAKITSAAMIRNSLQGRVICGPTTDQQKPFAWGTYPGKPNGSAEVFDFDWVSFNAVNLFPTPAAAESNKGRDVIIGVCIGVPLAALVVALVVRGTSKARAVKAGAEYAYKPLE